MEKKTHSPLAQILRALLDDSGTYARSEWAAILGVSEPAISQWVNDDTLPRPEKLRALWRLLFEDTRVSDAALERFEEMSRRPAAEISPRHAHNIGRTLGHYMVRPAREAFSRALDHLPSEVQEEVLVRANALCREYREKTLPKESIGERRQQILRGRLSERSQDHSNGVETRIEGAETPRNEPATDGTSLGGSLPAPSNGDATVWPPEAHDQFRAATAYLRAHALHDSAVMCHRTLEQLCVNYLEPRGSLRDNLRLLHTRIVEDRVLRWVRELELLRALGVHSPRRTREIRLEDAAETIALTRAVGDYIVRWNSKTAPFEIVEADGEA